MIAEQLHRPPSTPVTVYFYRYVNYLVQYLTNCWMCLVCASLFLITLKKDCVVDVERTWIKMSLEVLPGY